MSIRVECPDGHSFDIDLSRLGGAVVCPRCFVVFDASLDHGNVHFAKPAKGKTRSRDDDDDDDDDEDEGGGEDETPITWTPKKRQLSKLAKGLNALRVMLNTTLGVFGADSLGLALGAVLGVMLFFSDPSPTFADPIVTLNFYLGCIVWGPGLLAIYGAQIVSWFMGLFGPARSGTRGISIVAMILFFTPVLLLVFYFILTAIAKPREEVAQKLFLLILGIAFICAMIALFCSIVSIGGIAAYLNLTSEKNKPSALGWFILGGFMARLVGAILGIGVLKISPDMIGVMGFLATIGISVTAYLFALGSIKELQNVIKVVQGSIDKIIKDD